MSYKLNLTDGSLLLELIDGKIDDTSTDLTFIGKNYQGFGEVLNENFIKILENFNNTVPPTAPIQGQIWYDRVEGRLKVYNGVTFNNIDSVAFSSSQPVEKLEGDIWINSNTDQMYFYNGSEYVLVGPNFTKVEGINGYVTDTIVAKEDGQNKIVNKIYVNGNIVAILAKEEFTPVPSILGFSKLFVGYNVSNLYPGFKFNGTASTALNIQDEDGNVFDTTSFLKTSPTGFQQATDGLLHINNNNGLIVGTGLEYRLRLNGNTLTQETTQNLNYKLDLNGETGIYFTNTSPKGMGIFTDGPVDESVSGRNFVDVNGDLIVRGDLRIQGEQVYVDTSTLRVQDFQIELGVSEDSTLQSDADINEAGIIVKSADNDKEWTWIYSGDPAITSNWTSSENIDLRDSNLVYKIGGQTILSQTSLAASVTSAPGISTVGTLTSLQVDEIGINDDTITTSDNLNFIVGGNVEFLTPKVITGVLDPLNSQDAANKNYVDQEIASLDVVTTMDITGLGTDYEVFDEVAGIDTALINSVEAILANIAPAANYADGTVARIMGVRYSYEAFSMDLVGAAGTTTSEVASATQANPVVITTTGNHVLTSGDEIVITDAVGMTELNNERLFVSVLTPTTFELYTDSLLQNSLDGTGYNAYDGSDPLALASVTPVQAVFATVAEPFDAGGTLNKNALISAGFTAETEVEITTTVDRNLMYFTVTGGAWSHDPSNSKNDIFA